MYHLQNRQASPPPSSTNLADPGASSPLRLSSPEPDPKKLTYVKTPNLSAASQSKQIWIDLDNSPHVPFFAPIIAELEKRGCSVTLSARDAFQVCDLADLFHFRYTRIGRHYGRHKILKILGTLWRALQLLPVAVRSRPDLAISHGSRSQLLVCHLLGIPSIGIFDYEHAKSLLSIHSTWMMLPEVIPDSALNYSKDKLLRYPGIKEDVYAPRFKPDPAIQALLGISNEDVVVTLRPPANEAHYHNPASDRLFEAVITFLGKSPRVKVILVPRNGKQAAAVRRTWPTLLTTGKVIIPEHAVDGMNLIWHSDLVISGGGTMNREAAALGVPVYSIFRGRIGAVDQYLAEKGRLVLLESVEDVNTKIVVKPRNRALKNQSTNTVTLNHIVTQIAACLEAADKRRGWATPIREHAKSEERSR